MDFEAAPSQLIPLPVPSNYRLLQRIRRSLIAAERHQDVMESWRDIIKFESRQN
jgi:hypothetical protein